MASLDTVPSRLGSRLLPLVLLLAASMLIDDAACRPPEETLADFDVGADYGDVDNVELHHVRVIDGVPYEDYKVIMYKEDFVNEDYDPAINRTDKDADRSSNASSNAPTRKYMEDFAQHRRRRLNHTHGHSGELHHIRALKPEKIYFDILPQSPVVVPDELDADSKFDPSKIRFEVISLTEAADHTESPQESTDDATNNKQQLLAKRPKKYRRRSRRDTSEQRQQYEEEQQRRKRNPYYRLSPYDPRHNELNDFFRQMYSYIKPVPQQQQQQQQLFSRHGVPGKLWNSINLVVPEIPVSVVNREFLDEDDFSRDRVVWGSAASWPTPAEEARIPPNSVGEPPRTTRRPPAAPSTSRPLPPLFHDSNPEHADWSFTSQQGNQQEKQNQDAFEEPDVGVEVEERERSTLSTGKSNIDAIVSDLFNEQPVSSCQRASISCCRHSDLSVLYNCFLSFGCERSIAYIYSLCS